MTSRITAAALLVLAIAGPAAGAQDTERPAAAPLVEVLEQAGVDEVLLETTFRYAVEFNARPIGERRGARIVGVAESFFRALAPRVYPVRGPLDRERAREHLRTRLRSFLDGYIGLLIDQQVVDIELRRSETIDQYLGLSAAANKCNQIPCPERPCCKDCSAPTGDPPKCPP
jgi:hypothetical protein